MKDMKNDLVSRQKVIDEANAWLLECLGVHKQNRSCGLIRRLEDLPSAQPKAIRPKFVADDKYIKNHYQIFPHCPKCNYELETGDCYCRVCGCRIDWSEDDE